VIAGVPQMPLEGTSFKASLFDDHRLPIERLRLPRHTGE